MEVHSTERGCWVLVVTPIPSVLQANKVISFRGRPKYSGFYRLTNVVPVV